MGAVHVFGLENGAVERTFRHKAADVVPVLSFGTRLVRPQVTSGGNSVVVIYVPTGQLIADDQMFQLLLRGWTSTRRGMPATAKHSRS